MRILAFSALRSRRGLTLVELMITIGILSVGVLAAMGSFRYIATSIQGSKGRTLAINLCQEQVEKLKNLQYYTLLVTTATANSIPGHSDINYDVGNYPPAEITEGGIRFTRYTRVDFAYLNGTVLTTAPWTTDDTALKQISIYTAWKDGTNYTIQEVHNLMANPAADPLNATFTGTVRSNTGATIRGALVQVLDNPNWYAYTNASGVYRFNVSQGSYTLMCSTRPYYTSTAPGYQSADSGQTVTVDFTMTPVSTGTVTGFAYKTYFPVISAVAASTDTTGGKSAEYVEFYNPTTSYFNMGIGDPSGGSYWSNYHLFIYYVDKDSNWKYNFLTYVSTYMAPNGYYLVANTTTVTVNGVTRTADAYWANSTWAWDSSDHQSPNHLFTVGEAGGLYIYYRSDSGWWYNWDRIAWAKNVSGHTAPPGLSEGSAIPSSGGLQDGEQFVRMTEPGFVVAGRGRGYDSDDNYSNFIDEITLASTVNNKASGTQPLISGVPATNTTVTIGDPVSTAVTCQTTPLNTGSCPASGCSVCKFTVPGVATGTWTAELTNNNLFAQVQNVSVTTNTITAIPNAATTPTWTPVGGYNNTILLNTTDFAFVSGFVYTAGGWPLSGIKVTDNNGRSTYSASTGKYLLLASTGTVTISANPNDSAMNRTYVTQSRSAHLLELGQLYDETSWSPTDTTDFFLSLGGTWRVYFRTGSGTPLPGRVAIAENTLGGTDVSQTVSDNTGYGYLTNLSTGSYVITPQLDPAESASPSSSTVVLASTGTSISVTTFTVTNALSEITGQVLVSSNPITTGVLVMASTMTLTGGSTSPPPSASGSDGVLCDPCYYAASSNASGIYELQLRSTSSPYKLYGWYSTISGNSVTVTRSGPYSVSVSTGGQIISQNLSW